MSAFAVVEIPGVDWLRKFKRIVLFSVNNECDSQRFRVWLLSGEIKCSNARKTFMFAGFCLFVFLDK